MTITHEWLQTCLLLIIAAVMASPSIYAKWLQCRTKPRPIIHTSHGDDRSLVHETKSRETAGGYLRVTVGPMFSGKTTRVHQDLSEWADVDPKSYPLLINHGKDSRAGDGVSTHASGLHLSDRVKRVKATRLADVDVEHANPIGIDEGQWFDSDEDIQTILKWAQTKYVSVGGLDGYADQRPFGKLSQLLHMADSFTKVTAICMKCLELTPKPYVLSQIPRAPFTVKLYPDSQRYDPGGADKYTAVCRRHLAVLR